MKKSSSTGIRQTVPVKTIPAQGLDMVLTATPAECAELERRFNVPQVSGLTVRLHIAPGDPIRIAGEWEVDLQRECVVSLDIFPQHLRESFQALYADGGVDVFAETGFEISMDDEPVESIKNGRIDLGALIAEQFGLSLDPFPRKPDAILPQPDIPAVGNTYRPFADLKKKLAKK